MAHRPAARRVRQAMAGAALTALVAGLLPGGSALAASRPNPAPAARDVCGPARAGFAQCLSMVRSGVKEHLGLFRAGLAPSGYGPASLRSAYRLPSAAAGRGQTVAIVDAYDDPNAGADLAVYRHQYHLPPCTTATGCFRKVSQDGSSTSLPAPNPGWALEISLDLDMVSAICPNCHILLVEADDDSYTNLGAAVDEAVALGARYVSNSYGGTESLVTAPTEASLDSLYYDHPGVAITVSAGDSGYGVEYPAASPYVTAVGGTSLVRAPHTARGWAETAWSGTGSGCSGAEAKPAWQHGQGCAHRIVADVSADADPSTGVASYDSYPTGSTPEGWQVVGGTSVASPLIASTYALAGPPGRGSYPSSYPYTDPAGLNDITSGSNGTCTPAYLCTAGPGYDGPTGLGTPDGAAAFRYGVHGPHGELTGTVTDTATGKPLPGAQVAAGGYTATADAAGRYRLAVAPGRQDVTGTAFGYAAHTDQGVQVATGQQVTEDFALSRVPYETVSGTVTDGSGTHWPLAAKVSVPGTPATTYSNPVTGRYRLRLPSGATFAVQVAPVYPGYQLLQQNVTVPAGSLTQNFATQVDGNACDAPGYRNVPALTEDFSAKKIPAGWSVTNLPGGADGNTWKFDNPGGWPNATGGTGNYATAYQGNYDSPINTELTTPVISLSAGLSPSVSFDDWVRYSGMTESVDLSTDGGSTWSTAWTNNGFAPTSFSVPLPAAAGKSSVRLRFHLVDAAQIGLGPLFWQLDNVSVASCQPASGGLLAGHVRDANTGQGIDGATVTGGSAGGATSVAAPGGGFYWLFSRGTGTQLVTAAAPGYAAQTSSATVTAGRVTAADFTLKAGRIAVTPASVTSTETAGGRSTTKLTVRNTGSAPVTVNLGVRPGGFTLLGAGAGGAPLERVRGHFHSRPVWTRARAVRPDVTGGSPWAPVASLPRGLFGSAAAADPATGRVYVDGGFDGQVTSDGAWVLDPATGNWTALPAPRYARFGGQAAFIGGKFYVAGGSGQSSGVNQLEIYDPASRTWTTGTPVPHAYYGAATTVLDGKMYVIGGCDPASGVCSSGSVQVYNPATGQWAAAAAYPAPGGELGCGAITGKIYCAGGLGGATTRSAGYVYDPATNAWHPIAALPVPVWGSGYAAANGKLLMTGGVIDGSTVLTNQGYAYDPAHNTWSALPNAPMASYEPAGACGFYTIGGLTNTGPAGNVVQLPGYGGCGGPGWLSVSPARTVLAPGQSATITAGLAAVAPAVTQPGTYTAALRLSGNTPYPATTVPVTLTVTPPGTWGEITGTVSGQSCTGGAAPLAGASVQIDGGHGTWPLGTDSKGRYALWLDTGNDPLTVIASLTGWQAKAGTAVVKPGTATTHNVTLTAAGCG